MPGRDFRDDPATERKVQLPTNAEAIFSRTPAEIKDDWSWLSAQEKISFHQRITTVTEKVWIPQPGPQLQALYSEADELFFGGAAGGGKLMSAEGVILTPFGFKQCRDLQVGDLVNNPDGTIARIIQLHPYVELEKWTVHFSDGTSTEVAADHLWLAWRAGNGRKRANSRIFGSEGAEVLETRTLKNWVDAAIDADRRGARANWPLIPVCTPQAFNVSMKWPSKLDPYLLGYLLGDGTLGQRQVQITGIDHEHIRQLLHDMSYHFDGEKHYIFRGGSRQFLIEQLSRLGLFGCKSDTKFVPREFKMGSVAARLAVLQGLLDTDGTADDRGQVSYTTTSKQLAEDVAFIVRSLGGTATQFEKEPSYRNAKGEKVYSKVAFTLSIEHPDEPSLFRLERKRQRCQKLETELFRRVVAVTVGGRIYGRCLTVSHPNGLYLTNDFIVTHNSDLLLGAAISMHRKSIIFRREFTQFKDLVPRSRDILGHLGRFNQQQMVWRQLPGGKTIEFGSISNDNDLDKYKGRPHDLKAFDEVSDIPEQYYLFLIGWLRTEIPDQRTRVIAAGNPPTNPEGLWVIKRWRAWLDPQYPNPAAPGELRWYARLDDEDTEVDGPDPIMHRGEQIIPKSRTFIPALLDDNAYYASGNYRATLQNLPEPLRSQLLYGNFQVGLTDDAWQVIPTKSIIAAQNRWKERVAANNGREPSGEVDVVGGDIARGGKAKTCFAPRTGTFFRNVVKIPGKETPDGPTAAIRATEVAGLNTIIMIDIIGVGASCYDQLVLMGYAVIPCDVREASTATDKTGLHRFVNKRAEMVWKVREALDDDVEEEDKLALPPDPEITADLAAYRWRLTPRGIQVEMKEDIVKRIKRSPDVGDSLVMAIYITVNASPDDFDDQPAMSGGIRPGFLSGMEGRGRLIG